MLLSQVSTKPIWKIVASPALRMGSEVTMDTPILTQFK